MTESLKNLRVSIKEINPHLGAHFDEVVLCALAERLATDQFIGITEAAVIPKKLEGGSEMEWLSKGHLPLGQLGGIMDDKDPSGQRYENHCCATRFVEQLGVHVHELDKLLNAVRRVDSTHFVRPTELSSVMKRMNDSSSTVEEQAEIFLMMKEAAHILIEACYAAPEKPEGYVLASLVFERMIDERAQAGVPIDTKIVQEIRRQLVSSESQPTASLELSHLGWAAKVSGVDDSIIKEWYTKLLKNWVGQQEDYANALIELRENAILYPIPSRPGLNMVVITTNNLAANAASRHRDIGSALTIVKKECSGNVAILPNNKYGLPMRGSCALIRLIDTPEGEWSAASYEDYCLPGNHPKAPHWHMMPSGAILNGSNHIKVRATVRTLDEIVRLTLAGLEKNPKYIFDKMAKGEWSPSDYRCPEGRKVEDHRAESLKHALATHTKYMSR